MLSTCRYRACSKLCNVLSARNRKIRGCAACCECDHTIKLRIAKHGVAWPLVHYCLQHSLYFASCLSATSSVTCVADCLLLTLLCFSACLLTACLTHCLKHLSATCSVMRIAETLYLSGCLLTTLLMHRLKHPSATCPAMCVADCLLTTLFVLVWRPADNGH